MEVGVGGGEALGQEAHFNKCIWREEINIHE